MMATDYELLISDIQRELGPHVTSHVERILARHRGSLIRISSRPNRVRMKSQAVVMLENGWSNRDAVKALMERHGISRWQAHRIVRAAVENDQ